MSAADGMTIWTGDYLADTQHLSLSQHGAYLLLMMAMWRNGGYLPNNETRIANIVKLPKNKWRQIAPAVMELMTVDGDRFTQKRLASNLKQTLERIEKRRLSGKSGGEAKALKTKVASVANATPELQQSPSKALPLGLVLGIEDKKKDSRSVATATRPSEPSRFEEFWKARARRKGSDPRAIVEKKFAAVVKSGVEVDYLIGAMKRYAASERTLGNENTRYIPQTIKWLNEEYWKDYAPAAAAQAAPKYLYAKFGTPQLEAWDAYWRKTNNGILPIRDRGGGSFFLTEWPPDTPADVPVNPTVNP